MEKKRKKLQRRLSELETRVWNRQQIEDRFRRLLEEGLPQGPLDPMGTLARKEEILDRVQRRAEQYEYLSRNCAKGAALALMEEFGAGGIEMIKGLSPFPGIGMTGWICGAVTGALFFLGLYYGKDEITDYEATGRAMTVARVFLPRFQSEVGTILCPEIHEKVVFGKYMDPRASEENLRAFREARGYEKCALLPGIAARIAAEIVLEDLEKALSREPT
jgi:C_GCAxxG_C_C family probable redox protein